MATDRALLTKLQILAAKVESTTGTAETLAAADAAMNVMDMNAIEADIPAVERQSQGTMSQLPPVPGARMGKVTFKHEVMGSGVSGADPKWMTVLLGACGLAVAGGTWKPTSTPIQTITIGGYVDGRLFEIAGAMGKVTFDGEAGQPVLGSYEFQGLWVPPTAVALLSPTYPTVIPPRFAGATLAVGATSIHVPKFQLVIENTLKMREDVAQTGASGYHACAIVDRKITLNISPEAVALGTLDWYAAHLAGTSYTFNLVLGGSAHNTITIASPRMVLLNPPKYENDSGIYRDGLSFRPYSYTAGGDDELTIAAT
jgi:Phage tail tube protein